MSRVGFEWWGNTLGSITIDGFDVLVVEVREAAAMDTDPEVVAAMNEMRTMGDALIERVMAAVQREFGEVTT
jgi:hypothetical protein